LAKTKALNDTLEDDLCEVEGDEEWVSKSEQLIAPIGQWRLVINTIVF